MIKKELCIVHIGMPKTGSTTLEETFFENIEDPRVAYASLPESNHGCRIVSLFIDHPEKYYYTQNLALTESGLQKYNDNSLELLIGGFTTEKYDIQLISGEDLFHLPTASKTALDDLKSLLEQYFEKILIVAYVRPAKSFMESAFQQLVKHHELKSFDFNIIYHPYRNFKKYIDVFGEKNILLWKFDPENFPEGDIVLDFTTRLGLHPQRSKKKIFNESISMEAISILFTYHFHANVKTDFKHRAKKLEYKLIDLLRGIGNTKFRFAGSLMRQALEANKDDYLWITSVMGKGFSENEESLNSDGIQNEYELMIFATKSIPALIDLAGEESLSLKIDDSPQTVARLVDKIMIKLSR